jgi:hypothetical protein
MRASYLRAVGYTALVSASYLGFQQANQNKPSDDLSGWTQGITTTIFDVAGGVVGIAQERAAKIDPKDVKKFGSDLKELGGAFIDGLNGEPKAKNIEEEKSSKTPDNLAFERLGTDVNPRP